MAGLATALAEGDAAPARLKSLLQQELERGTGELQRKRSGYDEPVVLAFGTDQHGTLSAALPIPAAFRADPSAIDDRAWRIVAAAIGALQQATDARAPTQPSDLTLKAGRLHGTDQLTLSLDLRGDAELAMLAAEEALEHVDRLRTRAVSLPDGIVETDDRKDPIGRSHPLRIAEAVARLGGDPAQPDEQTEQLVTTALEPKGSTTRPHDDPDPAKRVARRILQRLDGMGKWGGYHTDFAHLARGFQGNDRALADAVGEALLDAELLAEKPSVGQRHVYLNPRQAGAIRRLIDEGELPSALRLPTKW